MHGTSRGLRLAAAVAVTVAMLGLPPAGARAQSSGVTPLKATLILKNPPPGVTYSATSPDTPVTIVLQLENVSGAPVNTTDEFSHAEFWRRLYFTDPQGGTIINANEATAHRTHRIFHCLSRSRVLQRPTAIPVVPIEVLNGPTTPAQDPPPGPYPFFLEYTIEDARRFFDLTRPGRYTVAARIPFQTFLANSAAIIHDCDQLPDETLVNVTAVTGRDSFTILSNKLEFVIGSQFGFSGFLKPLVDDSKCPNPVASPCQTFKSGRSLPLKFQLVAADGTPITNATARVEVRKVSTGETVTLRDDVFRFDPGDKQYVFNLHTRGLSPGVWRVDVSIDLDGSVHHVHFGVR